MQGDAGLVPVRVQDLRNGGFDHFPASLRVRLQARCNLPENKQPPQMELSAEAFAKGGDIEMLCWSCDANVSTHNTNGFDRHGLGRKVMHNS